MVHAKGNHIYSILRLRRDVDVPLCIQQFGFNSRPENDAEPAFIRADFIQIPFKLFRLDFMPVAQSSSPFGMQWL